MVKPGISVHHVMCPTDFSESAASAFAESVRLARWFGARITVLHVIPPALLTAVDMGYLPKSIDIGDAARKTQLDELRRFVDATDHLGVRVESMCREGDPCTEIREATRRTGADLLVMGTHGRAGLEKLVLGSVTEAILTHPPVPVLTLRGPLPARKGLFEKVLCAADGSKWSAATIAFAIELAEEGAEHLTVLSVVEDLPETRAWARGHFAVQEVDAFRDDLERTALAGLQQLIPDEARVSCRIEEHIRFGKADREILSVAAEEHANLIVLGNRGRGAVDRILFGSTARRVVRGATCPVVVVPASHAWPATALARQPSAETIGVSRTFEGGRP